jgi:hypothetical protein
MNDSITPELNTPTSTTKARELIMTDPGSHPDFLACNDPRLDSKVNKSGTIYVPNLVHLLFLLGGPQNVRKRCQEADSLAHSMDVRIIGRHGHVQWLGDDVWKPGSGFVLSVSGWHPRECGLGVIFGVPPKWHLGEWDICHVSIYVVFSATDELDRLVAECCDELIGYHLAFDTVRF